ncbi:MAG TPA: hypothetical protein VM368_09960 [Flavisolibacter sp.]|nr:hypothetical protein [Flavisolibacter sp.]
MKKNNYSDFLKNTVKEKLPLPYLMARPNKKEALQEEQKKIANSFYQTLEFQPNYFFKNITSSLPEEYISKLQSK